MFLLKGTSTAANSDEISTVLATFIEQLGGTVHLTSGQTKTVETRDGDFLSITSKAGYPRQLECLFGSGVDAQGALTPMPAPSTAEYWYLQDSNAYQSPISISCYYFNSAPHQVILFRAQSQAPSITEAFYLLLGRLGNNLAPANPAFMMTGSYKNGDISDLTPLPTISSFRGGGNRGRLHLPMNSSPTQVAISYNTAKSPSSKTNGQLLLLPTLVGQNYGASHTPGAGIPLTALPIHILDSTGESYYVGTMPGLYYGCTNLPDGTVISKGDRRFRLCKSGDNDSLSGFFIEVPGSQP